MVIGLEQPKEANSHDAVPQSENGDLPPVPAGLAGTSAAQKDHYTLSVSNAAGYLCHIHLEAHYDCSPETLFGVLSNPGAPCIWLLFPCVLTLIELQTSNGSYCLACAIVLELQTAVCTALHALTVGELQSVKSYFIKQSVCADNTIVFRDLKRVSSRRVLELDPSGRKVIEVGTEQVWGALPAVGTCNSAFLPGGSFKSCKCTLLCLLWQRCR